MAQKQLYPFRHFARQRIRQVQTAQTVSALGQTINWQLDRVGLLNYLLIFVKGTVTLSAGGAFADLGPWSLIDRIRVDLNLGNMNLVDISGYSAYLLSRMMFRGWALDGGQNWTPNANVFTAPVASGANTWVLPFLIPISANPGSQFDVGMLSLQAPEVQVNVSVRINNTGTNFVTNYSSISNMTVELHQCYFDYPDPNLVQVPPGQIVRTVEVSNAVVATGNNLYTMDRQGMLLQLFSHFRANGARSDGFDRVQLIANINDTIYDETVNTIKFKNEMDLSLPCPTGAFYIDLWHSGEQASSGDTRDAIDTEQLTTLQQNLVVSSGTTLGTGNNFHNVARRILVDFAQPMLSEFKGA